MLSIMLYSYHWTLSPPIVMTPISLYGMVRSSVFSCHQSWNTSPSPVFIAPFFSYPQKIRLSRVVQAGKVCSKVPLWWSGMQKRQLDPFILQKYEVVIVLLQLST